MTNLFTQLETLEPVAFGGFSELYIVDGKAVKLLEDACYLDVLEECYKQNIAAEAGLAPGIVIREVVVVNQRFPTGMVEQLLRGGGSDSNYHMCRSVLRKSGKVGDINPEGLLP